jgi:hypothetical protein
VTGPVYVEMLESDKGGIGLKIGLGLGWRLEVELELGLGLLRLGLGLGLGLLTSDHRASHFFDQRLSHRLGFHFVILLFVCANLDCLHAHV